MVEAQVRTQTSALVGAGLQLEVISSPARFFALEQDWNRLVELSGVEHHFLSFAWLKTWWEIFGEGKQLYIIAVRANGELIAAAPLMIHKTRMYGVPVRRLESIYNFHTPRYDFLIARHHDEAYRLIWEHMSGPAANCDVILLAQVHTISRTLPVIETLAHADGWLAGTWTAPASPFIRLGCDYEELAKTLTGRYRYNLRNRHDRLAKVAPVSIERITEASQVRKAMQDGLRIEAAAWKGEQGTAMNSDPRVAEFYIRLAERAAEQGWLQLMFLKVGDQRVAFDYILRNGTAMCGVKIGYDPKYHTYSPGNMLLNLILQEACNEGATEYDFLGVDDEWKFDWTRETRSHEWLFLSRKNLRGRLAHKLKFNVVPALKKQKQLLRLRDALLGLQRALR